MRFTLRGAAALSIGALVVSLLGSSPAGAADEITPGAPPMPKGLAPGDVTTPTFPVRSVPGFATPSSVRVRLGAGEGRLDKRYRVPTPLGSTLLWGDWNRDGAFTPIVYNNGQWVVYDQMLGATPAPTRAFSYGLPGDRPVVGDWDRDGDTDIGVVRGATWYLRTSADAGAPSRRFRFGRTTDVPVVGDWNGNGKDDIGVRRGADFYLRTKLGSGPATYSYRFGRPTDLPVVGDWDGDGVDAVGVVRRAVWHLRSESTTDNRPKPTVTTRYVRPPREAGAVPAPWPTPAGPDGQACPSASAAVSNRPQVGATVRESVLLDKNMPYDEADPAYGANPVYQTRVALMEAEKYLLGAQYLDRYYKDRRQRYTDILSRFTFAEQEYAVRRPAMAALTTAVATRTRAHNDAEVGRTRDEAIRYSDWLVRSIACEHVAVSPGGWGGGWQSAHWAFLAGEAAWLIWDYLTPQTREYVAQMLVYEADRRLMAPVEYWADESGQVLSSGNTKAEENSWNAGVLELASTMMPKHPQAANWRRKATDLELAAYASIGDASDPAVINGMSLADRLEGANTYNDGTVENHRAIHPDYITNIQQNWWAADIAGLAGLKVKMAALNNAARVYGSMTNVSFTAGAESPAGGVFAAPGGTIYQPGTNEIYYPQGSIWGTGRRAHFVSFDAHAYAYGLDSQAAWSARDALASHVAGQLALVANNGTGDGRTYSYDPPTANAQDSYNGREEYAASQLAAGWLALYVSANAWDQQFNLPPLDAASYPSLPVMTQGETGWFGRVQGDSPDTGRLSP